MSKLNLWGLDIGACETPIDKKCLCCGGPGSGDAEVVEEGLHVDAQGFVVAVDAGSGGGLCPIRELRMSARVGQ